MSERSWRLMYRISSAVITTGGIIHALGQLAEVTKIVDSAVYPRTFQIALVVIMALAFPFLLCSGIVLYRRWERGDSERNDHHDTQAL